MDQQRFDALVRLFAAPKTRRGILGAFAVLGAGLFGSDHADAQVTQATCGNLVCGTNPAACATGCVCCTWSNGNSRCTPPTKCTPPGSVATITTTTTTTTTPLPVCVTGGTDGALCGTDGACDDGRCFRRDGFCDSSGGCSATTARANNSNATTFCLSAGFSLGQQCTNTSDCPAGEFCGIFGTENFFCAEGCPA